VIQRPHPHTGQQRFKYSMDKQTTIGFILIALILLIWMWVSTPQTPRRMTRQTDTLSMQHERAQDSLKRASRKVAEPQTSPDTLGRYFNHLAKGTEKIVMIETDLYKTEISTKGGLIRKWELKRFTTWDNYQVQLVNFDAGGDFSLLFTSSDGKLINTRSLYFDAKYSNWQKIKLSGDETYVLELTLNVNDTSRIVESFRFENGRYSFDVAIRFEKMQSVLSNYEYQIIWENGLRLTEENSRDEASFAAAYAQIGGELVEVDAKAFDQKEQKSPSGSTDWVATRTKYFAVALIADSVRASGAYVGGISEHLPDDGVKEDYSIALKEPLRGSGDEETTCTVFLGPLDFYLVKSYGVDLERIMSFGLEWIIRPISIYFMLPLFKFLHTFIPNYGVVIIVFTLIIRLLLYPLTHSSMKSMKKMQALQPMMTELKEKYKEDPQRMNREVMKLYKEYGVNPASGCLLMLPQMPILYALWAVFRSAIELRQASFIWWIKDLSTPDTIVHLPFAIPLFGVTQISGLALFMGITMFVQQKMTVKDPRQKTMVWFLPVMMTLLFNSLPSGLNLYYSVFNLLAIGQQLWIAKHAGEQPALRKVDSSKKKRNQGVFRKMNLPKLKR
jgi:YidC/Oxa1 family membrane protein insertase